MDLSTVGGWLACRGAGQYSTRYGKIEDMVVGLEVVLADGRVVRTEGKGPRAATGPNLTQLFVGSEGTLGVITEARLRIHPLPPAQERRAFGFATFAGGLEACRRILRRGATPAVLRLYDQTESARNFDQPDTNVLIVLDEADPAVLVGHDGGRRRRVRRPGRGAAARRRSGRALARAPQRRLGAGSAVARRHRRRHGRGGGPVGGPARALRGSGRRAARRSTGPSPPRRTSPTPTPTAPASTSPSAGAARTGDADWRERYYRQAWDAVTDATLAHGAAISHHHGIGLNRSRFLPRALGAGFDVLRGLKADVRPERDPQPRQVRPGLPLRAAPWA